MGILLWFLSGFIGIILLYIVEYEDMKKIHWVMLFINLFMGTILGALTLGTAVGIIVLYKRK